MMTPFQNYRVTNLDIILRDMDFNKDHLVAIDWQQNKQMYVCL